jgi:Glu-tRNA(Gln) amidotransferase subunit E-like FAD-binding protein
VIVKQHNLSEEERKKLLDPFPVESEIASTLNDSLPYEELDGLRFERLCYEILCSDGKNPRYNGNSGQQDYGVDIVTEHKNTVTVYQCKNIKDKQSLKATAGDIKSAYSKVVERWVGEQKLPNPTQFVYYSRQRLAGIKEDKEYTHWRDSTCKEREIDIQLWGRETLNSKLRDLPAVVSGVFSDGVARTFCDENSLPSDSNWERLQHAKSEYPTLRDFYEDWKKDKLFINPDLKEWFSTAISASSVILLQGVPGTGKTTTTLSLLATLQNRPERIYYTLISNFEKIPQLLDSVKKRAQLPSVFILDDCHSAPDLAVVLIQRLRGSLLSPNHTVPIKFVLLMRGTPEKEEDTYCDSIKRQLDLTEDSAKNIPLSDSKQLLQVLKKRLPHINPITKSHAEHVFNLTGGNLKLANLAVDGIDSADGLLWLDGSSVKQNVYRLYISKINDEDRQRMKKLCALAMFDITPLTDYLVLSEDVLCTGLVTQLYSPNHVRFSDSSLAEVLFYVLVDMDDGVPDNWNGRIKQELIRYFEYLCAKRQSQLDSFLLNLSSSQLYFPDFDIDRIISKFLDSSEFKTLLTSEPLAVRVSVIRRLLAKASLGTSEAIKAINDAICRQLKYLYGKTEVWNEKELTDFSNGIFGLCKSSPDHLRSLESQLTVDQLITKIRQSCYIFELFSLLQHSSPSRAGALIGALESSDIDALVDKTVEQHRSVGTLNMALRDLGKKTVEIDGTEQNLLTELEQIVTVRHLRKLIVNNGTVLELFRLLQYSSPSRAGALIGALESPDIDALVDKTVEQHRSVGTLDMALRDLGKKTVEIDGEEQNLLTELEQIVTVRHLRKLIINNGTVFELFNLLEHSSPCRAGALIGALESPDIDALVDKTVEQHRSVGTLNMALRDLGKKTVEIDGTEQNLLTELEQIVTARHLRELIVNNGTVFELFNLLKHSSPCRAGALIGALESPDIDALVDKTVEQHRSVGTLNMALRDLGKKTVEIDGTEQNLLTELEQIVTARHLRKLIVNNGTVFELFKLLENSSPCRAGALIGALESPDIDALVDKTVEKQQSVGTLHMALRDLGKKTVEIDGEEQNLLTELEQIVTAQHLRKLIVNNGTVLELFSLLRYSSPCRAGALIGALESSDIDALVDKTVEQHRSVGTLNMALRDLGKKTVEIDGTEQNLLTELEQIVTVRHLRKLIVNNGTVLELFRLLQYSSPSRAGALLATLESPDINALVDKTVEQQLSIETLHYTFDGLRRYRSLLEELLKVLSPPIFARLIVRAGTLNSLMLISSQLPEKYLSELRVIISQYPRDEWQELVFRGLPSNLVNFLSQDIEHYPDVVRNLLDNIVANEGTRFLKKSSWYELNTANYDRDEPITTILREQLEHLLASTPADALLGFDFKETTNAVSIMWRHATPQHAFLNARLWELLPPQPQWPKDYGFGFLSNVIQHLCHKDFNRQNAKKLLCKASDHALQVNWTKATPSLLFSFFWQLWQASYHLSVSDPSQYFPQSLSDNAIDLLKKLLSKKKYRNSDKIALYALAGLLLFIRPEKERELRGIVKGRLTGLYYLRDEIRTALANNGLGFVAGYFALYGMGLVCHPSHNFTIGLRMALKARFREYPHTTQAVDTLFSDVEKIR